MHIYPPIIIARFWSKVQIPECPNHLDLCWNWRSSMAKGYGQMKVGRAVLRAHRMAFEMFKGPVPPGLLILHSCDNPRCVNPKHLRAGTHQDNRDDRASRA